jgi:hypothetical protein
MKQGASRHSLADRKDDLYETPDCATLALLRNVALPRVIWEPCAGRGAISRLLHAAGHTVIAQDLNAHSDADRDITPGIDFLMERRAPDGAQTIVTNPPYKLSDEFIRHGLALGCDVIVLLRLMAIEGAGRADIIEGHLLNVYAGIERLPFMHRDGWDGPKNANSGAPFAWFHFAATKRLPCVPIQLRRMSWRAA